MYYALKNLFVVLLVAVLSSNTFGAKQQEELSLDYELAYGEDASIEEHPYMASIDVRNSDYIKCSGSLISSTCVLTSAHCLHEIPKEHMTVRAGSKMYKEGGSTQSVANSSISGNIDIAVLKLNGALKGENIKLIEVNAEDIHFDDKTTITVAGWSANEINDFGNNPLRKIQLVHVDIEKCPSVRNSFENSFCAKNTIRWAKTKLCGDYSGGPAIINGKQVGIVSVVCSHYNCSRWGYTAFTRLGTKEVSTFLKEAMQKLEC